MNLKIKMTLTALVTGGILILFALFEDSSANAMSQAPLTLHLAGYGAVCPLTEKQVEESLKTFAEMEPTFRHPRCSNCHGGVIPFSADGNHAGGKFDLVLEADGEVDIDNTFSQCQACHSGLPDWKVPPSHVWFVDKDPIELCQEMKSMGTGAKFINHITHDSGDTPFIATAFAGKRGLSGAGEEFYEALNDTPLRAEPPPVSHATLISQAKAWVEAQGGEFRGDIACGCLEQKYALQVDESLVGSFTADGTRIDWDGSTQVQIPLTFQEDGAFHGAATSTRTVNAALTSQISCSGTTTTTVNWQVEGHLDFDNQDMTFRLLFSPSHGSVTCNLSLPIPLQLPIPIDNTETPDNPLRNMKMYGYVGESETVELKTNIEGSDISDKFTIEIIKVD